jgi:hypothetical protein
MVEGMARIAPSQPNEAMARIAPRSPVVPMVNNKIMSTFFRLGSKFILNVQIYSKRGLG